MRYQSVIRQKSLTERNETDTCPLSLVHTVPVYAPVRPCSLQPVDRGESGRIGTEFDCVHIFPAELRTRPGLGHKFITVCLGNATVCDGAFPV